MKILYGSNQNYVGSDRNVFANSVYALEIPMHNEWCATGSGTGIAQTARAVITHTGTVCFFTVLMDG
jgi:hypothetical protein